MNPTNPEIWTDGVHLITTAGDIETLHGFAELIGLRRKWFREHPIHPHYDLTTPAKYGMALKFGAMRVTARDIGRFFLVKRGRMSPAEPSFSCEPLFPEGEFDD